MVLPIEWVGGMLYKLQVLPQKVSHAAILTHLGCCHYAIKSWLALESPMEKGSVIPARTSDT